jgi:hypothetical protein
MEMKPFLQKLVETASDAKVLAASIGQAGIQYVQGLLGGIPLVSSISALSLQNVDRDETHYLLIPFPDAFINPVLGAGIAAKGLLPSVGAKASIVGIGYVSEKLRKWNQSTTEARITKEAQREVKRLKPELFHNPLLQSVDALLTNPNAAYDPFFAGRNWVAEFPSHRYFKVTVDGIAQTYNDVSEWEKCPSLSNTARQWITHLIELNKC